ncbi:hypothetical protein AAU57_09145 [Nonlabens sp. YIK11]|uniref:GldL-related protein n=1 Tax=Nonlabens sp. YIK11 TaxID=1453349 RepID=UPI0006DCAF82|nr:hypothetical protein [Nonlabens sp. YIK11]KQC33460.1 hypothetical protein AAU57_09145 [Nonlabens sp. YIK11]
MKNKGFIIILIVAIILIITGALFKIMHWGFGEGTLINGNTILATGLVLKVVALFAFMGNILTTNNSNE